MSSPAAAHYGTLVDVISDHFADVGKMVELGSGSQREIDDVQYRIR